jgi:hypothetical protein
MNTQQLSHIIEQGDTSALQKWFKEMLTAPLTPKERGDALISISMMYMKMKNNADSARITLLEETLKNLKIMSGAKKKVSDAVDLAKTRSKLS